MACMAEQTVLMALQSAATPLPAGAPESPRSRSSSALQSSHARRALLEAVRRVSARCEAVASLILAPQRLIRLARGVSVGCGLVTRAAAQLPCGPSHVPGDGAKGSVACTHGAGFWIMAEGADILF